MCGRMQMTSIVIFPPRKRRIINVIENENMCHQLSSQLDGAALLAQLVGDGILRHQQALAQGTDKRLEIGRAGLKERNESLWMIRKSNALKNIRR